MAWFRMSKAYSLPKLSKNYTDACKQSQMDIYLVGGAVREIADTLSTRRVVVGATLNKC